MTDCDKMFSADFFALNDELHAYLKEKKDQEDNLMDVLIDSP